jgi:hypothetical protein
MGPLIGSRLIPDPPSGRPMSDGSKSNQRGTDPCRWWLCSHLVRVILEEPAGSAETGVLEEIREDAMRVAVENRFAQGQSLDVQADGFERNALVAACSQRETDYLVELRFTDGFRWTPEVWTPEHLYLPEARKSKAKRASSGA